MSDPRDSNLCWPPCSDPLCPCGVHGSKFGVTAWPSDMVSLDDCEADQ